MSQLISELKSTKADNLNTILGIHSLEGEKRLPHGVSKFHTHSTVNAHVYTHTHTNTQINK